ncbi:unnamed protein product [Ceratitis capitata]|uniref:(Mediterranean fruit fly) hypothetical protein n=1 Tax=Ceratitis capitata TaxID=7213 RepID=A0A811UQW9_CERCA|nr:unnamed protein product [Ceratitis capitata]
MVIESATGLLVWLVIPGFGATYGIVASWVRGIWPTAEHQRRRLQIWCRLRAGSEAGAAPKLRIMATRQ